MPRELGRHGQSDRAGANDQNVRHRAFLHVDPSVPVILRRAGIAGN